MHARRPRANRLSRLFRAPLLATVALAALTCQDNTTFHLAVEGGASLGTDQAATVAAPAGLAAVDLGSHMMMVRQDLSAHTLDDVRPYAVNLTVTRPATGQDLAFLGAAEVVVSAPGLADVTVARGQGFASGTNAAGLTVEDVQLRAYAHTRKMAVAVKFSGGQTPPQAIDLNLELVLDVAAAQPKGACG